MSCDKMEHGPLRRHRSGVGVAGKSAGSIRLVLTGMGVLAMVAVYGLEILNTTFDATILAIDHDGEMFIGVNYRTICLHWFFLEYKVL